MKAGPRTSEFYMALLAPVIAAYGVLSAQFGWSVSTDSLTNALPVVAALAAAVASHGYSKSRSEVKAAVAYAGGGVNPTSADVVIPPPPVPPVEPPSDGLAAALAVINA